MTPYELAQEKIKVELSSDSEKARRLNANWLFNTVQVNRGRYYLVKTSHIGSPFPYNGNYYHTWKEAVEAAYEATVDNPVGFYVVSGNQHMMVRCVSCGHTEVVEAYTGFRKG